MNKFEGVEADEEEEDTFGDEFEPSNDEEEGEEEEPIGFGEMGGTFSDLGKDIAMHIAASKPQFVSEDQVPSDIIEKEKDIFRALSLESGKPADIIEKMITGQIRKFLAEVTLLGQPFIKDDKVTVGGLVAKKGNKAIRFIRFEVGEGIEKKEENFAEEVMAQVRGS